MATLELWGTTPLWGLTALCFLGTLVWRMLGAMVAAHIDPEGAAFQWLACVAYAMLAGLIARILLLPIGILAQTPTFDRAVAMLAGFALFFLLRRHVFAGTLAAFAVMLALTALRAGGLLD
ncbi:MAG: AzlD domain-containing protein [Rhodospirillaceae bacterium]|jgi:branched-subunit amino acid transport protein